jgi:tRNA pseudouridine55 synthase
MAGRRQKGRDVSGWLCLDKAAGQTSTQAVASVKRLFNAAKAGHAGTLDPLATGALPIALGEATKTVPFVQDGRKVYRFTVRWGGESDTDDSEGRITATSDLRPARDAIERLLPEFTGDIMQRPPAYSAIKVEGERAYDLARGGQEVVLEERPVAIHRLQLVDMPDADTAVFEAECGKGTYVRSLARDLGRRLGCLGHVVALRRLSVGPFAEDGLGRCHRPRSLSRSPRPRPVGHPRDCGGRQRRRPRPPRPVGAHPRSRRPAGRRRCPRHPRRRDHRHR